MNMDQQQLNQQLNQNLLQAFWTNQLSAVEQSDPDFKTHTLPIARIKKVMKSDVDVKALFNKMISAEAPVMFAKACEIFIEELTLRAWMHAEENKRRTIQKSDIATAVSKSDMYDFLIDIVPREVDFIKSANGAVNKSNAAVAASNTAGSVISNSNSLITPQRSSSNKNMDDLYGNGDSFNNSYPYHSNYGPPQHESFNNYQSSTDLYSRYPSNAYSQQQHVVDAVGSGGGSAVNAVNGEHSKEALSEN